MTEEKVYDRKVLQELWDLPYKDLCLAPSQVGRLREARFVLQVRTALETSRYTKVITAATVVMALATIVIAAGTIIQVIKGL